MEPLTQLFTVAICVGLFNGIAFLRSDFEVKARQPSGKSVIFGQSNFVLQLARQLLQSLLGLAAFLVLPLLLLAVLDLLPLHGTSLRWFFAAYLVAIGGGKLLRFAYWKRKFGDSLP